MGDSTSSPHPAVVEIIDRLQADGLDRFEYQLAECVDPDELHRVVTSGDPTEAITFHVEGRTVTVSGTGVVAIR